MTSVLIVGAGPAGIRAAEILARAGLRPVVVDEGERAGGQIYRCPPDGFARAGRALYGSEAGKAAALHATFDALVAEGRVDHRPRARCRGCGPGRRRCWGRTASRRCPTTA